MGRQNRPAASRRTAPEGAIASDDMSYIGTDASSAYSQTCSRGIDERRRHRSARLYASPLGTAVGLVAGHRPFWGRWGLRVLGLGYAPPFSAPRKANASGALAFMPANQGVVNWPGPGPRPRLSSIR